MYASVSVCALVASRFEESLELTLSPAGTITAMSYTVPRVPEACPSAALPKIMFDDVLFNTAVSVIYPPEGPKPIGQVNPASFVPAHAAQAMQQAAKAHADGTGGGAALRRGGGRESRYVWSPPEKRPRPRPFGVSASAHARRTRW